METVDQTFEKKNYTAKPLPKGEYEACRFDHCDFSNTDLSDSQFIDCVFTGCNLSLVKLVMTVFRDVIFKDCKMLGLRLDTCSEFGLSVSFEGCTLNHSSFYKRKIKKTRFKNTQLKEVDFTDCDAGGAIFDDCDLTDAKFDNTGLERADFRTAIHYSIDPERNRIKRARFSNLQLAGLLDRYDLDIDG